MSRVAIVRVANTTYDPDRVEQGVQEAIALIGGMGHFVHPGQRVLLKPNLLRKSDPSQAVVTHPSVVRAVTKLVQAAGGTVTIGDSPGGFFSEGHLRDVYERTGMLAIAEETGATLNLNLESIRVSMPEGRLIKAIDFARFAVETDVVISLSKLKTHELMGFTGAVKNLFGLIPGLTKAFQHAKLQDAGQFADMLLDIANFVKPAINLMDAIVGMDGDGPSAGDPFPIGALLASTDPVALDFIATQMVGLELDRVVPLRRAKHHGMLSGRLEDVEIVGLPLAEVRVTGFRPASSGMGAIIGVIPEFIRRYTIRQLVASPHPNERCIACGVCVKNCPVKAIKIRGGRARVDLGKCIRCYCCHELCPENAIDLMQPWLMKILR